jgi:hypothetical protein
VAKKDGSLHVFESTLLGQLSVNGITGEVSAPAKSQSDNGNHGLGSGSEIPIKTLPQLVMALTR